MSTDDLERALEGLRLFLATNYPRPASPVAQTAPAVPLPPEILIHICTVAFESLDLAERQHERRLYTRVCTAWYQAFRTAEEFHVEDDEQAGKLAIRLETMEQGCCVVRLYLDYDTERRTFNNLIRLLNACPNLVDLSFVVYEGLGDSEDFAGPFLSSPWDRGLLHALGQLSKIEVFSVDLGAGAARAEGVASWSRSSFNSLLSSWKHLARVHITNICLADDTSAPCDTLPRNIRKVWTSQAGCADPTIDLMYCSRSVITNIGLFLNAPISELALLRFNDVWKHAAPNLTKARVGPLTTYHPLITSLVAPRTLELQPSMQKLERVILEVDPAYPATVFNTLADLPKLHEVTLMDLNSQPYPSNEPGPPLPAFIHLLSTSRTLRTITLSAMGRVDDWFDGDGDEMAEKIANEHNVLLAFQFAEEEEDQDEE